MRLFGLLPALLLSTLVGCTCCPNYYGPSLTPQPYGSCVGTRTITPPVPMGKSCRKHRPSLAEHKQARDLRRWYKELNREPRVRRGGRPYGYDEYYDQSAYYDEGMSYDGYYDGQMIDGGIVNGGEYVGSDCPTCQAQQHYSQPMMHEPMMHESMMPQPTMSQPMMGEPAPAPPAEPTPATTDEGTPSAFLNELYSPQPGQPAPLQQVNIPPVEQVLYAPTGPATSR